MRKSPLTIALALASLLALGTAGTAFGTDLGGEGGPGTGHEHPAGGSPFRVSLVPAFVRCTFPGNADHDPTQGVRSCNPPVPTSSTLAVGPSSLGFVRFIVLQSGQCAPFDPTKCYPDASVRVSVTDVRSGTPTGPPYSGGFLLRGNFVDSSKVAGLDDDSIQITDAKNQLDSPKGACTTAYNCSATQLLVPFSLPVSCSSGTCNAQTTLNTMCAAGCITAGGRAVFEIGQLETADMSGNRFEDQGIFLP
jgi:hypothetical protein